jgi:2,4-dienoyl-CoA reductase-like NADH-dependent reductase (Old Yellow Enzyme family)
MSILFTPEKIGNVEIKNRFVRAATYEGLADESGRVTDRLLKTYSKLAKGDIGLILSSFMYVHPHGKALKYQLGIYNDEMVPGLKKLVETVHEGGGKIAFEITHGGRQAKKDLIGRKPLGPSAIHRDPTYFVKPVEMTSHEINDVIDSFIDAARRTVDAGADIIYLHAGGGDLLNQFLSPYFNNRKDEWGGSDENRFLIIRKILEGIKKAAPGLPILVKMNAEDFTPEPGMTPELSKKYVIMLESTGIDALELTSGIKYYNPMNCWRGDVPYREVLKSFPLWKRPVGWLKMKWWEGKYDLVEGWNMKYLDEVKELTGEISLFLVGGMRNLDHMEDVVKTGKADFICMCRPFIREPGLVKKFKNGRKEAACNSCNRCFAAAANNIPTLCYKDGFKVL